MDIRSAHEAHVRVEIPPAAIASVSGAADLRARDDPLEIGDCRHLKADSRYQHVYERVGRDGHLALIETARDRTRTAAGQRQREPRAKQPSARQTRNRERPATERLTPRELCGRALDQRHFPTPSTTDSPSPRA